MSWPSRKAELQAGAQPSLLNPTLGSSLVNYCHRGLTCFGVGLRLHRGLLSDLPGGSQTAKKIALLCVVVDRVVSTRLAA